MKKMSSFMRMVILLAALVAVACSKTPEEESGVEVEIDYFLGSWMEYYGPDFHIEGGRTWHIGKDSIRVYTYDWYSDTEWEKIILYTLYQKGGEYIVVLHSEEGSETGDQSYYITKLTDEEMIWQSVDSGIINQHFVSSKFWQTHDMFY